MSTSDVRRTLREQFGRGNVRIGKNGNVSVRGPLPLAPHLEGWHLHAFITERGLEPVKRPAVHLEH